MVMKKIRRTPGVYIQEVASFSNNIVPVSTAVTAFIGYTGKTTHNGKSLTNKAIKVNSLAAFEAIYGNELPQIQFAVVNTSDKSQNATKTEMEFTANGITYGIAPSTVNYRLHGAIRFFYANGGGACYIVSTGGYDHSTKHLTSTQPFEDALQTLENEPEPTIVVIPDAVELIDASQSKLKKKYARCYDLQSKLINHCGTLASRVAILDIPEGYTETVGGDTTVGAFRDHVSGSMPKFNSYAAAYYPWLKTTVHDSTELSFANMEVSYFRTIAAMLNDELAGKNSHAAKSIKANIETIFGKKPSTNKRALAEADTALKQVSLSYQQLLRCMLDYLNTMPPSGAMAGIYTMVDNTRGVWKAPANVSVVSVTEPTIQLDNNAQDSLNVSPSGKSICAIRAFPGKGNLVWGARTLDGNSNEFRYIPLRRTIIFIEQSIKQAAPAYMFSPNEASTWTDFKNKAEAFLNDIWRQGGLAGSKPEEAYAVKIGLGSTMTQNDIANNMMIMSVFVALVRPAEFIAITIKQKMAEA